MRDRATKLLLATGGAALLLASARPLVAGPEPAPTNPGAVDHFAPIYGVLMSPRCMNCHPVGDAPLQTDRSIPHAMNVSRKSNDAGLQCMACHRAKNNPALHGPPGVPNWHMPPATMPMVFEKKTPKELCEQLKDPRRNGGKSLEQLAEHMGHDPLVLWGWSPGGGRTLPPIPHAEFAAHVNAWTAAGAPCPP